MALVNWWLIIIACVLSVIIFLGVFYLIYVYASPEDSGSAWLPKIVVVLSFTIACCTVLLLPFDVANRISPTLLGSTGSGLDVALAWKICICLVVVFAVVVCPFGLFYYEAMDPEDNSVAKQIVPAVLYTILTIGVFIIALVILWFTAGNTQIPYEALEAPLIYEEDYPNYPLYSCNDCTQSDQFLEMKVSIVILVVAAISFFGWILFIFFGGMGIPALPMDLFREWYNRPKPISVTEYGQKKQQFGERSLKILEEVKKLQEEHRKHSKSVPTGLKRKINKLKLDSEKFEEEFKALEEAYVLQGGSPFVIWGKLLLSVISWILSIMWLLHIFLHNILQMSPFLNNMFVVLSNSFAPLGAVAYGVFTFYLLCCVIKGVVKVGMKLLFFEVHPMKVHDTPMNSFLFNSILILGTCVTVTQFATMSFRPYAAHTSVDSLFITYLQNMKWVGKAFKYFQYAFFAFALLSTLTLAVCCTGLTGIAKKKAKQAEKEAKRRPQS